MSGNDTDSFLVLSRSTAALPRLKRSVRRTRERQPKETMTSLWLAILLRNPDSAATGGMLTANLTQIHAGDVFALNLLYLHPLCVEIQSPAYSMSPQKKRFRYADQVLKTGPELNSGRIIPKT